MPATKPLSKSLRVDVCIVGGGIAGLTTAYLLTNAGKSVVLLDDGSLGGGMTGATSAHLSSLIDAGYCEIERLHGFRGARVAATSHAAAIDRIERIVRKEKIDCDFTRVDGYLFLGGDSKVDCLVDELKAAKRAGLAGVTRQARASSAGFETGPCLRFPRQAQFHPIKYLAGVARAIKRGGGQIYTNTHADTIKGGSDAHVIAGRHTVQAGSIVVTTNSPVNDLLAIHTKMAAYMSYVIGVPVAKGAIAPALYWDTADPYHFLRLVPRDAKTDLLIVGGEDHKTGQAEETEERHRRLEDWARARIPAMGAVEIVWAGQIMESIDGLAFIGRNPLDADNVYVATGDSGLGLTHGTIAGEIISGLILKGEHEWAPLYDPTRKTVGAAATFAREALNMAAQYRDWISKGDVATADEIAPDHGAVMRQGLRKIAVYRDEAGAFHRCSAVCPHLGGIVRWNSAEKTWDCPCHGSRFDKMGKVINGPANRNLARVNR
jgi:glycine/D-amino acid oxidase-like deaminating enzyme/nitrite reductase/ring-hydroxylating ferredoxin subunit